MKKYSGIQYRVHCMTLIEVVIAMALTIMVLTLLLSFYSQVDRANTELEKEQDASFQKLFLANRLASVLPKIVSPNDKKGNFFFYTSLAAGGLVSDNTPTLVFTFDNGVKLDPSFSNYVLGRLYVDEKRRLCLAIMPSPPRWIETVNVPIKIEVLFENVDKMTMEFYIPPVKDRNIIWQNHKPSAIKQSQTLVMDVEGGWKTEWMQEYNELPVLIRLKLEISGKPLILVYPIPMSNLILVYDK